MKNYYLYFFLTFLFSSVLFGQTFDSPESAVYDSNNSRYLISNTGNGDIIARDDAGNLSFFNNTASESTRGLTIFGDKLYAAGDEGLLSFELATGDLLGTVEIAGASFLNDVTASPDGIIYVSDDDVIYKVDPDAGTYELFLNNLNGSNGLLYQPETNTMLVTLETDGDDGKISSIDIATKTVTDLVTTSFQYLDGLAQDQYGRTYISSWSTHMVYQYDANFTNPPEIIYQDTEIGPADIFYDSINNILVIPEMNTNTIQYVEMPYITVTSPNGGESLESGTEVQITWDSRLVDNVDIYYSTDNGDNFTLIQQTTSTGSFNWTVPNESGESNIVKIMDSDVNVIYDISDAGFTIGQATAMEDESTPREFKLDQNYPNPFNPSTTIKYVVGTQHAVSATNVILKVFDVLGNEITTLVNKNQSEGEYSVSWDATNYSSGIYYYTLQINGQLMSRKMTLLK